jgi:hypothetical protein
VDLVNLGQGFLAILVLLGNLHEISGSISKTNTSRCSQRARLWLPVLLLVANRRVGLVLANLLLVSRVV